VDHVDTGNSPPEGLKGLIQQESGWLERFYDAGIRLPAALDRKGLIKDEAERIEHALVIVLIAGEIPRRLGGYASDRELADDKKRARRVSHVLSQSYPYWSKRKPVLRPTVLDRRAAAQIDWDEFSVEHTVVVGNSLRRIATWAIQREDRRWGKSAVVYLTNELRWMNYALR
jgi:hypothetical protein